jgi:hypothetical protein
LRGRFYFKERLEQQPVQLPSQWQMSEAERAWNLAKDTQSIDVLQSFITRYKDTFFADLARERLEQLMKANIATTKPTAPAVPPSPNVDAKALAVAPPPSPANTPLFMRRSGEEASGAPAGETLFTTSIADCELACTQSADCQVYTYYKPLGACRRYARAAKFSSNPRGESGVRR